MTINSHPSTPFSRAGSDTSGTPILGRGLPCLHFEWTRIEKHNGIQVDPFGNNIILGNCDACGSTIKIGEVFAGEELLTGGCYEQV